MAGYPKGFGNMYRLVRGFSGGTSGKKLACQCRRHQRRGFYPWVGKAPWRRAWQPTLVFLPGESHGQRSLVGYSPQGHTESDTTEATQHTCMAHTLVLEKSTGKGNKLGYFPFSVRTEIVILFIINFSKATGYIYVIRNNRLLKLDPAGFWSCYNVLFC